MPPRPAIESTITSRCSRQSHSAVMSDLRPARSVHQHGRVGGVAVRDGFAAVDQGTVGGGDEVVGPRVVGRQKERVFVAKARLAQGM